MDYRKRTHRPKGYNEPGHAHELTFSCYKKYPFLSKDRTCEWLAEQLAVVRRELNFHLILKGKTLLSMIDYTHMNPERKGFVQQVREWKWSSAGWFEGQPLNQLMPDPIPVDWLEDT